MTIDRNKMVTLTYDLRLGGAEGEVIEQATVEQPLKFIFGTGLMLPMFEAYLVGKAQGEKYEISLKAQEAYGERDEEAVVELPKDIFVVEGKFDDEMIAVGNHVPMMTQEGHRMNGLVLEVTDEIVKMDFNHPLAGDDLFFSGDIIEVRDATDEEIAATMNHGCGGGCNCGDGDCGDGCDCDDDKDAGCCGGGCDCH
ncbi:MAG: peptidylprolyl isomerase [Mangrovibacterium sp.]